jgi:hypothetical protein
MKTLKRVLFMLIAIAVIQACTSGKGALKQGDYYDAVLESVKRLRESPPTKNRYKFLRKLTRLPLNTSTPTFKTALMRMIQKNGGTRWMDILKSTTSMTRSKLRLAR